MTTPIPAAQAWQELVEARERQAHQVRPPAPRDDYWGRRVDARSTLLAPGDPAQDPLLARILELVRPTDTVLDIGAGGGRYAIPLAHASAGVIAIEPSPAMASALRANAAGHQAPVQVIEARWEDLEPADVPTADVVVCANVITPVARIQPFLQHLVDATRRDLVVIVRISQLDARTHLDRLWPLVHGEPRVREPGADEALAILHALGARTARLGAFEPAWRPRWRDRASAERELATNLMLGDPPSGGHDVLARYLDDHLVPAGDGLDLPGEPLVQGVITWSRP